MSCYTKIALVIMTSACVYAGPVADKPVESLTDLSLQVWALQALHDLDLTAEQLKVLRAMATETAAPAAREQPKVAEKYVTALRSLRDALVKGDDDEAETLRGEVESMQEDDDIDVDDSVAITDAARRRVPEVIRLLAASQVASYVAAYQDEAPDPMQSLMDAVDELRDAAGDEDEAKSITDDAADDVAELLAGLDVEKQKPIKEKVRQWLGDAKKLSDADFNQKRLHFEQSAKAIVGDVNPFIVLRHWLERDVAELLSNPQLTAAIDSRSKAMSKDK